jgi:hypothetical protein
VLLLLTVFLSRRSAERTPTEFPHHKDGEQKKAQHGQATPQPFRDYSHDYHLYGFS